jgi:hypothetical protein
MSGFTAPKIPSVRQLCDPVFPKRHALGRRIARLERARHGGGDWRRFGDDPRDMPDWALVAAILWELESDPNFRNCAELIETRRLYAAGEIDAAFNLLGGALH